MAICAAIASASLTQKMHKFAEDLEFEKAAELRDVIHKMEDDLLLVE